MRPGRLTMNGTRTDGSKKQFLPVMPCSKSWSPWSELKTMIVFAAAPLASSASSKQADLVIHVRDRAVVAAISPLHPLAVQLQPAIAHARAYAAAAAVSGPRRGVAVSGIGISTSSYIASYGAATS